MSQVHMPLNKARETVNRTHVGRKSSRSIEGAGTGKHPWRWLISALLDGWEWAKFGRRVRSFQATCLKAEVRESRAY